MLHGAIWRPLMEGAVSADGLRGRCSSGVLFAVLFTAGIVPLGNLLGSFGDSDATFVAHFDEDSNRVGALVGGLLLALGALSFLWFLSHLRTAAIGAGSLPSVVGATGTTFVVPQPRSSSCSASASGASSPYPCGPPAPRSTGFARHARPRGASNRGP